MIIISTCWWESSDVECFEFNLVCFHEGDELPETNIAIGW